MKILAIDTSSQNCSVAVLDDVTVQKEKHSINAITHSEKLMVLVDTCLEECNISLHDIDLLACSNGPGSFTGVRIGVSTIKAFADVTNLPIVSVSSLEGLAYNILNSYIEKESHLVCTLIDAKNDNVYGAVFRRKNNLLELLGNYEALSIQEMMKKIKKNYSEFIIFIGDGAISHKYYIIEQYNKAIFSVKEEINIQNSISIGICGYHKYQKGDFGDSNFLLPLYLKKSQAERALEGEL